MRPDKINLSGEREIFMEKQKILVVDDDREIVRAIAINLEREGFEVLCAYDGLQALETAMNHEIQLIIMDVMMPKMDGLSAVLKIREKRNIPIIVLSAKSEDSDKILGLSMGAGRLRHQAVQSDGACRARQIADPPLYQIWGTSTQSPTKT